MQTAKEIQLQFINKVKESFPVSQSFVDELAELLHTSNDSAYRRMRGDTLLSIDEVALICNHFKVAFEPVLFNNESASFSYNRLKDEENGFSNWFISLLNNVKRIAAVADNDIIYAADDVPIWHHFNSENLLCFKLFYWQKSILNRPEFANKLFGKEHISDQLIEAAKNLVTAYDQTNSTEIWTEDTLNSTLKQIEYYWESGFLTSKADALQLCDEMEHAVNLLKLKAESKSKITAELKDNFTLYQSEVMVGNNSILVRTGNNRTAFVSNNTFNIMSTSDSGFIGETEMWLNNIIKRSILISGVNEKQRNKFFRTLLGKIDALRLSIN